MISRFETSVPVTIEYQIPNIVKMVTEMSSSMVNMHNTELFNDSFMEKHALVTRVVGRIQTRPAVVDSGTLKTDGDGNV